MREDGLDPLELKGSYAGAMGMPQFMPENYRKLAVDFDNDGTSSSNSATGASACP